MQDDPRAARRKQIEAAAYDLLAERGYAGTSMLAVARRARASNETLYAWYGDKLGLFTEMVRSNAARALDVLEGSLAGRRPPRDLRELRDTLIDFGTVLLRSILSERAVALNRVAVADGSGALGKALAAAGRDRVVPLLAALLSGVPVRPPFTGADDLADTFVRLLVGDLQIRRAIRALDEPDEAFCRDAARSAVNRLLRLAGEEG